MQFDRVINFKVLLADPPPDLTYRGSLTVQNLRIAFSITKSMSPSTNTASVRVWNLGSDSRNELRIFGDQITLYAGYRDPGPQILFVGNTTLVSHIFSEPEIISVFDVGDGEKSINTKLVNISFGPGTPARTVIQSFADQLGLKIEEFSATDNLVYPNGFTHAYLASHGLDKACDYLNLVWSVQNNNLIILKNNTGSSKPIIDINADTGMIGTPQRYTDKKQYLYTAVPPKGAPKNGWKVRCLLRPDILPGQIVRIRSDNVRIDGFFYVLTVRHEGDNYGPTFESSLEVIEV